MVVLLLLLVCSVVNYSCSDDTSECEMSNQGTVILDNTKNNGTLYVFFNPQNNNLIRGTETIRIAPNQTGSVDFPAGPIDVKAYVFYNTLNIGDLVEKDIDLDTCEKTTIVY